MGKITEYLSRVRELKKLSETFKTKNDFQDFINENNVKSCAELKYRYRPIYNALLDKKLGKSVSYTFIYNKDNFNSKEDFQKLIDDNNIPAVASFRKSFMRIYLKAIKLGIDPEKDFYYHPKTNVYDHVTLEDAQKFVEEHDIKSLMQLSREYHEEYLLFRDVREQIDFSSPWDRYNTLELVQNFINENNIDTRMHFLRDYPELYGRCQRSGFLVDLVFEGDYAYIKYKIKDRFKSLEDIYSFMREQGITRLKHITSTEEGKAIYHYAYRMGWKIEFPEGLQDLSRFNTKEDFQGFIEANKIQTMAELINLNPGLSNRLYKLGLNNEVEFPEGVHRSVLEIRVAKELDKAGISYLEQETFSDLKDKGLLRFDFLIESKKLILEPGGVGHLAPVGFSEGDRFELVKKHDEMKREYCKKKGYTILYLFVNDHRNLINKEEFERLVKEYPGECYTIDNFDSFINRILSF